MDSSSTGRHSVRVAHGEENELVSFGRTVRALRSSLGLSQEVLADKAELDRTYVSDIERGNRNVALRNIHALARALSVDVSDLFPRRGPEIALDGYLYRPSLEIDCGFRVSGVSVLHAVLRTNSVMNALPTSLFRTVDFKAQSGMVGAVFASELAAEVGAIPNPIEKGHPDIVPADAAGASEPQLRNYPSGLEVKSTVGSIRQGIRRDPCSSRIGVLTALTWQAHHREVEQLMGITWDYVDGAPSSPAPPVVTGVFYADDLTEDDWGAISGTTGRNTKVTGMRTSGRVRMAAGAAVVINRAEYLSAFRSKLGTLPLSLT